MTKQMLTSDIREKLRKSYRKISETKHKRRIRYTSFIHPLECMKRRQKEADVFQKKVYFMNHRTHVIDIVFGMILPKTQKKKTEQNETYSPPVHAQRSA